MDAISLLLSSAFMLQRFLALARAAPDAPALIDGPSGRVTTRAGLLARAEEIGGGLSTQIVPLQLPNSVDFVATFVAVLMRERVMMPIDRDAPPAEVEAVVSHFSGATALPPETRLLKLTSGSTGLPKAIAASEANLLADCVNICSTMEIRPEDVNFGAIPMSHSYGFSNLVSPLLVQGTALVMSNDYLPESVGTLCDRYQCTVVPAIPMVFEHLAAAASSELASVRTFISAGAPLPPATSQKFQERFGRPIHNFYGCSECGGITYDGRAMRNVTLASESSRLTITGANVTLGYLHDASNFEPFESGRFVADDLVEIGDDGEVVLTGRASELINTAGKKVNPREVEQIILQLDGVRQAKVYGEPAGARGELVAAAVVASPDVTREAVREFCRARLSPHKVPRIVKLIDAIPVDERGKVRRSALAAL
jgi:acyl-CoA synthetase (AMP-forming)/AMP-acid ligase II